MRCGIHQIEMAQEEIPILYGKPATSEEYSKVRNTLFPHAKEACTFGGCEPKTKKTQKTLTCPKCNEVRQQWLNAHKSISDPRI
jgi:hypothetical protein